MTNHDLHAKLLLLLSDRTASLPELSAKLELDQQDIHNVLKHPHFAKVAGASGWEWTVSGSRLHMAARRERLEPWFGKRDQSEPSDYTPERGERVRLH